VLVDPEGRGLRHLVDHALEAIVAERLDPPAVAADQMMVMIGELRLLVLRCAGAKLEPDHEAELGQRLERAIDAGDADARAATAHPSVNVGHGHATTLLGQGVDHGCPRPSGLVARLPQRGLRVLPPGHAEMIALLIPGTFPAQMSRTILVLIFLIALVPACGGDSGASAGSDGTNVVAAFYPLAWAAERVGGDQVNVRNLTPPGAEPHDVELTPRDVERIRSADVVVFLGAGFQPAVEDAVEGADGTTVDVLEGIELAPAEENEEGMTQDPHIWLDPTRYATAVETIAESLDRREQGRALVDELEELDRQFEDGLSDCERRELVTTHAAFGYLAARYDLEQISISGLTPEVEPTPRALEQIIDRVRASGATTIFFETLVSPRLAETVARETGAKTAVLDPLEGLSEEDLDRGADYLSVMRDNLAALRRGLGCR
jgi:zinc transport system substrate-binding protein